ncbi:hypothetical protein EVAR_31750_1 [Eumeta japonica]|uniref:Uncharacterized protein n=1 Tax=Eumeta variegata TaxID=151549 RepID=A0A4C1W6T4_EUMVA|nr:hypothetical protein EVAR_31750_1 [Eumeta japonica]
MFAAAFLPRPAPRPPPAAAALPLVNAVIVGPRFAPAARPRNPNSPVRGHEVAVVIIKRLNIEIISIVTVRHVPVEAAERVGRARRHSSALKPIKL